MMQPRSFAFLPASAPVTDCASALRLATRRRVLRAGGVSATTGLGAALLAGCGAGTDAGKPAASKAPVTLSLMLSLNETLQPQFQQQLITAYRADHPNVSVDFIPYGGGTTAIAVEKLLSLMTAGSPPNVWDGPRGADYMVGQGLLAEMDPLVKRDKVDTKRFNQKQFEYGAVYQNKIWMLPYGYGGNALALALNTEMFKASGVPIPSADAKSSWTWDQWLDAAQKLTKSSGGTVSQFGIGNYGSDYLSWPLLFQGDWITPDLKSVVCDSAAMQECYTRFFELPFRYRVMPRIGEALETFGNANPFLVGKAAMAIVAPSGIRTYTTPKNVEFTLAPMPRAKISTPDMNMMMLGIVKGSKDAEESWSLIRYLTDGSKFGIFVGRIPTEVSKIEATVKELTSNVADPRPQVVLSAAENAVPQLQLGRHPKSQDLVNAVTTAFKDAWAQKIEPVPMLKALKAQLTSMMG
jgi:multiple sugar transport system substrate-binding protein